MPTEMLGPGTEAALELLVETLEDGGWDPFKKVSEDGKPGGFCELVGFSPGLLSSNWIISPQGFGVKITHNLKPPPPPIVN